MKMTALVGARAGGGYVAWVRDYASPIFGATERDILLEMRNRLIRNGQQRLETRARFRYFEQEFRPWKPGDDGE